MATANASRRMCKGRPDEFCVSFTGFVEVFGRAVTALAVAEDAVGANEKAISVELVVATGDEVGARHLS